MLNNGFILILFFAKYTTSWPLSKLYARKKKIVVCIFSGHSSGMKDSDGERMRSRGLISKYEYSKYNDEENIKCK